MKDKCPPPPAIRNNALYMITEQIKMVHEIYLSFFSFIFWDATLLDANIFISNVKISEIVFDKFWCTKKYSF